MYTIRTHVKSTLADTSTPVSLYLKVRDLFPQSILLESSDYHGGQDNYSFLCLNPVAGIQVDRGVVKRSYPDGSIKESKEQDIPRVLEDFISTFLPDELTTYSKLNGFFGYMSYDSASHFEKVPGPGNLTDNFHIPEIRYHIYQYIVAINHFKNSVLLIENLFDNQPSTLDDIEQVLANRNYAVYPFSLQGTAESNMSDSSYRELVALGKKHCHLGDVYQMVLSRRFDQAFTGDEFNVYRCLRSVNPSPYLFYFDYAGYKIFGSSPEAHLIVKNGKAFICPIAGTFKRTGDDASDRILAEKLGKDPKENAEHVMLVDLARNDLSRYASNVTVEVYQEVQFYSHVLHLVSTVSGVLPPDFQMIPLMGATFPAGTLSGAPKIRAMELISKYETTARSFYGGCIGQIGFDRSINQAIMIRSVLSHGNRLVLQAGAGIVADSNEEKELQEVNNKLAALRKAIEMATTL